MNFNKGTPKSRIRSVQILQVVAIEVGAGEGTAENPNRIITEYWSIKGEKLAQSGEVISTGAEHKRNGSFANGVCVGASVIASVISLIVLLMQLR